MRLIAFIEHFKRTGRRPKNIVAHAVFRCLESLLKYLERNCQRSVVFFFSVLSKIESLFRET